MNPQNRYYQENKVEAADEAVFARAAHAQENRMTSDKMREELMKQRRREQRGLLCKGFLMKRGEKVKGWKRRHFEIDIHRHVLAYAAEDGFGILSTIGEIALIDAKLEDGAAADFDGKEFVFCITPKDSERVYILHAESAEERTVWCSILKKHISFEMEEAATIKEGELLKEGENIKSWKKRTFKLTKNALAYYKNSRAKKPTGIIPLLGGARVQLADPGEVDQEFAIAVAPHVTTRVFLLAASSQEEMVEWIEAIKACVGDKSTGRNVAQSKHTQLPEPDLSDTLLLDSVIAPNDAKENQAIQMRSHAVRTMARGNEPQEQMHKEGFLMKLGAKVKNWKKRYFVVVAKNHEVIYRAEDSLGLTSTVGTIHLLNGADIQQVPPELHGGKEFLFSVTPTGNPRAFVLQASSEEERDEWMAIMGRHARSEQWAEADPTPLHEGTLVKQGEHSKGWKTRYFIVRPGKIDYYRKKGAKKPTGTIDLLSGARIQTEDFEQYEQEFCFTVTPTEEKRTYALVATSAAERQIWLSAVADSLKKVGKLAPSQIAKLARSKQTDKSAVTCEGHLTKMGDKVKNWKRRWCVLESQIIKYYKASKDARPTGEIDLSKGCHVAKMDFAAVKQDHAFAITCSGSKRTFILVAENDADRENWVTAIKQATSHVIELEQGWEQRFTDEGLPFYFFAHTGERQSMIPRPLY